MPGPSRGFLDLAIFFNCDDCVVSDPSGLHTLVCDINREDLREQSAEVEASALDGDEKNRKRTKFHTRFILGPLGGGLLSASQSWLRMGARRMTKVLSRLWSRTRGLYLIRNVVGDRRAFRGFSEFVPKCPEGIEPLGREEFRVTYLWHREEVCSWAW